MNGWPIGLNSFCSYHPVNGFAKVQQYHQIRHPHWLSVKSFFSSMCLKNRFTLTYIKNYQLSPSFLTIPISNCQEREHHCCLAYDRGFWQFCGPQNDPKTLLCNRKTHWKLEFKKWTPENPDTSLSYLIISSHRTMLKKKVDWGVNYSPYQSQSLHHPIGVSNVLPLRLQTFRLRTLGCYLCICI